MPDIAKGSSVMLAAIATAMSLVAPKSRAASLPDLSQMVYLRGETVAGAQADWYDDGTNPIFDGDPTVTRVGRAAYEFPLPNLASGGLFADVTTKFTVTAAGAGGTSVNWAGYEGDGYLYLTSDLFGSVIQTSSIDVRGPGTFAKQFASILQPLPVNATSWFGVRLQVANGRLDISRGDSNGGAPTLTWSALVPKSGTVRAEPVVEATAIRTGTGDFSVMSQQFDRASDRVYEREDETRRGILEYYLAGIPRGAIITSASLVFDGGSFAGEVLPDVYGFSGDGVANAVDANATLQLGSGGAIVDGTLDQTIVLDAAAIQSLLAEGDHVGIQLRATGPDRFAYTTGDFAFGEAFATRLDVTYSVPEPATLGAIAFVGGALLRRRRTQS